MHCPLWDDAFVSCLAVSYLRRMDFWQDVIKVKYFSNLDLLTT